MVSTVKSQTDVALRIDATLGEGAIWDSAAQRLLWVDIIGKQVGIFNPATLENQMLQLDSMVGTVVPATRGDLVVALQQGIARLDRSSGRVSVPVCPPQHDAKRIRFNDGKCDPRGRLWAGTMALDFAPGAGALYCCLLDGTMETRLSDVSISNGIVWSHDERRMYYIDTPTRRVDVFEFSADDGQISRRRCAFEIPAESGYPDGMTIDADGMLWIAMWGGSSVQRWNPESGKMIESISIPAAHVTSCAFGGRDLTSLYITTAREGRTPEQLAREPLSGSIFVCTPGAQGMTAIPYAG